MKHYNKIIDVFYRNEMSLSLESIKNSVSKSPSKPQQFVEHIFKKNMSNVFSFKENFNAYTKEDFLIAHTEQYVEAVFNGDKDIIEPIFIDWSSDMVENVKWTNSSLYAAILNSINNPNIVTLSPTSGFHHAVPFQGYDFCTFSGQVIASSKIYDILQLSGCYIDLDAHFGNSIESSRKFVKNLNKAIPKGFNVNPTGFGHSYIKSLDKSLKKIKTAIIEGKIHYVVFCHGADSHIEDDLKAGVLTTAEWLECSKMVYQMIEETSEEIGKNIPLTLCLFGGYRSDNYEFVLDLHLQSIMNSIK